MNQNVSVTCLKQIEIGVNCIIANNVVMVDHDHDTVNGGFVSAPIKIGDNVWILSLIHIFQRKHFTKEQSDENYVDNWSLFMDLRIIVKSLKLFFTK